MRRLLLLVFTLASTVSVHSQFLQQAFQPFNIPNECGCLSALIFSEASLPLYHGQVFFTLYHRNLNGAQITDGTSLQNAGFNPDLPLKIIIHGFLEKPGGAWMVAMKDKFLSGSHPPMNVVLVDWSRLSKQPSYEIAANHAIYVGRVVAQFLSFIKGIHPNFSGQQVHIIGFSMGAHVAGIAGNNFPGIARISGLDPAGPVFECANPRERLTNDDADFVDAVHTNDGCILQSFIGHKSRAGHQDFYVNGGATQPGCPLFELDLVASVPVYLSLGNPYICHHHRATDYYLESISTGENVVGYECPDYDSFKKGNCLENQKAVFGYNAKKTREGAFYLGTQAESSYFQRYLRIEARPSNNIQGKLNLQITGRNNIPNERVVLSNNGLARSQLYTGLVGIPMDGSVNDLTFTLVYEPLELLFGLFNNVLQSVDVVAIDTSLNKRHCVTPAETNNSSPNIFFARMNLRDC